MPDDVYCCIKGTYFLLGKAQSIKTIRTPIPKIKVSSHQGEKPASLNLLAATAKEGSKTKRLNSPAKGKNTIPNTKLIIKANNKKYQNSGLFAVPSKARYFFVITFTK